MEETNRLQAQTIRGILQHYAVHTPSKRAFLYRKEDGSLGYHTYRRLKTTVDRIGTALAQRGFQGKNIAVIGHNSPAWAFAFLSVCCGLGTVVPVDREMSADSLQYLIRYADIKAVFADQQAIDKLRAGSKKLPRKTLLISLEEERIPGVLSLDELIREGESLLNNGFDAYLNAAINPDDPAFLLFTSGTTGTAKAVMLSNRNICSDLISVSECVDFTAADSTLCLLPLHHTYQMCAFLMLLSVGGSVSFCKGLRFVSRDLAFFHPTVIVTVPLMLEKFHKKIFEQLSGQRGIKRVFTTGKMSALIHRFEFKELRRFVYSLIHDAFGGRLRMIIVGAAALNPDVAKDFHSFGIPVVIGYGLTECSPIVMCNRLESARCDSIGRPIGCVQVMLDRPDESGAGEICVKGPNVMLGYYKNKKATAAVMKNGWLHTGDLGIRDADGFYHITGRCKNVIVTKGGKNIYPEEIEYYLNRDPLVLESLIFNNNTADDVQVAVAVVPDQEAIKEKLNKDKLTKEDIQKAVGDTVSRLNRMLPSYKSIRRVFIREKEMDKTSTQKINRSAQVHETMEQDESTAKKEDV